MSKSNPKDLKLTVPEIIFIVQYWHQRDRNWGRMVTEEELTEAGIGIRFRRKMLRVWGSFDAMLTPGHFDLAPGDPGIGAPAAKIKPKPKR